MNISVTASGTYSVKVIDANNCFGTAQTEVKVSPILAYEPSIETNIKVYPNPVSQRVVVSYEEVANTEINISLVDIKGRLIEQRKLKSQGGLQQEIFDVQHLARGQYLIKINTSTQEIVKKLVVE